MASRRKSAKPTNKLRQVHIENDNVDDVHDDIDDNDLDDDCGDDIMLQVAGASLSKQIEIKSDQAAKNFKSHMTMSPIQALCPPDLQNNHAMDTTRLLAQHINSPAMSSSDVMEPLLALPSDVFNDFEALRSTTKLDSPALMRRLLKYYSKLTSSTVDRERKLDNVIEGIRGRNVTTTANNNNDNNNNNSSNNNNNNNNAAIVLDLSVHKKAPGQDTPSCSVDHIIADDSTESDDSECSPRPLDLTLQKEDSALDQSEKDESMGSVMMQHGTASSLFSTPFKTPVTSSCVHSSTDMNQAAPYVINLESLTSTIQLSTPTQQTHEPDSRNGIQLPTAYDSKLLTAIGQRSLNERPFLHGQPHKSSISNVITGSQNVKTSIIPITIQNDTKSSSSYPPSALFPLPSAPLPSYKEAINSSLLSKHGVSCISSDATCSNNNRNIIANDTKTNKELSFKKPNNIDFASHLISSDGRQISVLQLNPDFHNVKSVQSLSSNTPENFLLEPTNRKHSPTQETNASPNFLLADAMPTLSSRLASSPLKSPTRHQSQKLEEHAGLLAINNSEPHGQRVQVSYVTTKSTRSQPSPAIVSGNTIHTILSSATPSSQSMYPQSSMPLQSLLMSQSSDGSVSSVVAIPVLQGLPEGYTTLQHFTFEPAVPLSAKSEIQNTPITTTALPLQPIIVSAPITTTNDNPYHTKACTITNPAPSAMAMLQNSDVPKSYTVSNEPKTEWVKLKPGRPKGRTAKTSSPKKNQNKGMKLVTEHSLFPGVYTSILKLPWSKRTRNKSKAKPDSFKNNNEAHSQDNIAVNVDVEMEERNVIAEANNYIPPELVVNVKDPMTESLQEQLKGARNENTTQLLRQHIGLDQQQQQPQPYRHQYQVRLSEEQQKTTNDVEVSVCPNRSPCTSPTVTCQSNATFTENLHYPNMNIKREMCDPSELCSEIRHNVMLSSASIAAGQEQSNNMSNSHDPIMLIYPNIGPNGSKSKKRRGRPPKKPIVEPKVHQDSFLFPVESIFHPSDSISDTSFLHGSGSNLTLIPSASTPLNQEFTLMSPTTLATSLPSMEKPDGNTVVKTFNGSSDFPANVKQEHDETTLENRIIYLTNQIEMEMARGANQQTKEHLNANTIAKQRAEQNIIMPEHIVEPPTPLTKTEDTDKPTQGVKRRRKKTSRMLKSNENFVYATFRFKPRGGSGIKKTKKKRKASTTSLTVNAETIANLRNKKLKCLDGASHKSDTETAKNDLGVQSWKFHEQYPSDTRQVKSPVPTLSIVTCSSCSMPVRKVHDVPNNLHFCRSCQRSKNDQSKDENDSEDASDEQEVYDSPSVVEKDGLSLYNSCISCGRKFEGFSDSDSQCDICRRNTPSFIGSSKLFSIHERAQQQQQSCSPSVVSTPPSSDCDQLSESTTRFTSFDPNTPLTTDGTLYCYLCRMQFSKINEYLLHLKETHEGSQPSKTLSSLLRQDIDLENAKTFTDSNPRRIKSTLKTKKSLAHKTITCPIEDCPLFFRHQRDMDHHLKKVHQTNSHLSPREIRPAIEQKDISTVRNQVSNLKHMSKGVCTTMEDPHTSIFNPHLNTNPVTVTLEENDDVDCATHELTQEKPLRCSFCNFRCRQKNAMTWHMRKHPEAASQYRCYSNASSE